MQIFLLFVIVLVGFIYCSFCDIRAFCQCHYGLVSKVIQLSEKKKKKKKNLLNDTTEQYCIGAKQYG
jgi:hypothetical protein